MFFKKKISVDFNKRFLCVLYARQGIRSCGIVVSTPASGCPFPGFIQGERQITMAWIKKEHLEQKGLWKESTDAGCETAAETVSGHGRRSTGEKALFARLSTEPVHRGKHGRARAHVWHGTAHVCLRRFLTVCEQWFGGMSEWTKVRAIITGLRHTSLCSQFLSALGAELSLWLQLRLYF